MDEETTTSDSLPEGQDVSPADGNEAGSNVEQDVDPVVKALSDATGKKFETPEAALKAVKDTFSYVGKQGQTIKSLESKLENVKASKDPEVLQKVEALERDYKSSQFYTEHPEYKPYRDLISSMGTNPSEVIQSDVFKQTFDKLKSADESAAAKSVLQSNPRLGQVTDKLSTARNLAQEGKTDAAYDAATQAVIDAYSL